MPADSVQRIAAAVTPAVMVSACGLIALGLDNQAARVSARLREMTREYREPKGSSIRREDLRVQVEVLGRRHALYVRALLLNYGALLLFVLTSLLSLAQTPLHLPGAVPVIIFTVGVLMLGAMSLFVLASLRLSRAALHLEQTRTLASEHG